MGDIVLSFLSFLTIFPFYGDGEGWRMTLFSTACGML